MEHTADQQSRQLALSAQNGNAHEWLEELFAQLTHLTGVKDIAYHRIVEGRLVPVHKTNTDNLGVERWKQVHARQPVYVAQDKLLQEMLVQQTVMAIQEVRQDPRSAEEFFLFGIESLLLVPVCNDQSVVGLVLVAAIGELHAFSEIEQVEAVRLVAHYKEFFLADRAIWDSQTRNSATRNSAMSTTE